MCGITGLLFSDRETRIDKSRLEYMRDLQQHRGPDEHGIWIGPGIGLAHRRLSIIGLADGQQPMTDQSGQIHVSFNGEIYNYPELRRDLIQRGYPLRTSSDTEVLLYLYQEYGPKMVQHLRGMFAFALWDSNRECLLLARDRVGQKPLYYHAGDSEFVFASELKSILAFPGIDPTLDPEAIEAYLTYGFIPESLSIYKSVRKLPPAHTMLISRENFGRVDLQRYWSLEPQIIQGRSESEWIEVIREKLSETVRCHSIADVNVGAFLSGGVDSSVMVAEMSEQSDTPLKTFSVGFDDESTSELPFARLVAERYRTDHIEEIVTPDIASDFEKLVFHYDEPFADSSAIPTMAVARVASEHVKVAISGDGGDEAFGGYSRYRHDLKEAMVRKMIPGWIRRGILGPVSSAWPRADWLPRALRLKSALTNLSREGGSAYANTLSLSPTQLRRTLLGHSAANGSLVDHIVESCYPKDCDELAAMTRCDISLILPDDFLVKVDRASMSVGLEVRPPMVDHEFLELTASIPSTMKIRDGEGKWIFKQAYRDKLPDRILSRKKQGFELPIDRWLRGPLRDQMKSTLDSNGPLADHLDLTKVRHLVHSHERGTGRHGGLLWAILVFDGWLRSVQKSSDPIA